MEDRIGEPGGDGLAERPLPGHELAEDRTGRPEVRPCVERLGPKVSGAMYGRVPATSNVLAGSVAAAVSASAAAARRKWARPKSRIFEAPPAGHFQVRRLEVAVDHASA